METYNNWLPGIFTEATPLKAQKYFVDGDKVRFRNGQPGQIGGWSPLNTTQPTIDGVARAILGYEAIDGTLFWILGTNRHLYAVTNGVFSDITPYRIGTRYLAEDPFETTNLSAVVTVTSPGHGLASGMLVKFNAGYTVNGATIPLQPYAVSVVDEDYFTITATGAANMDGFGGGSSVSYNTVLDTNPFATVSGSATVTVTLNNNGLADDDIIYFPGSTTVNGITITGQYSVLTINSSTFTIVGSTNANATSSGGGSSVVYDILIHCGLADQTTAFGWSTGTWSGPDPLTWSTPSAGSGIGLDIQYWFLQNFGQDVVASLADGPIYYWTESTGVSRPATLLTTAPHKSGSIIITPDRFLISFGSSDPGTDDNWDPKMIRWANQNDPLDWDPTQENSAGFTRINSGSTIMTAVQVMLNYLVLTDVDAHWMQPLNTAQPAFGVQQIASGCGAISKRCAISLGGTAYWMGSSQFYMANAGVEPIPCTVLGRIFQNINYAQSEKIYASTNAGWNEIWWWYPSTNSTEIDSYVIYNYVEKWWTFGTLDRTAWTDVCAASSDYPVSVDTSGILFQQETDNIAGGTPPMNSFLLSGPIDVQQSNEIALLTRIIPDVQFNTTSTLAANCFAQITCYAVPFIQSTEVTTKGPYTITPTTPRIDLFLRGRQMQFKLSGVQGQWKWGQWALDLAADGLR